MRLLKFYFIVSFALVLSASVTARCAAGPEDAKWRVEVKAADRTGNASAAVASKATAFIDEISGYLGHEPSGVYEIFITPDKAQFRRHAGYTPPEWAVAVYSQRKVVISPEGLMARDLNFYNTLEHELVHAVLDHQFGGKPELIPHWLNEGLAVVISDSWEIPQQWSDRKTVLYASLRDGRTFDFSELGGNFPRGELMAQLAYAQSADFVQYLVRGRRGWERMRSFLDSLSSGIPMEEAFAGSYRMSFQDAVERWEAEIRRPGALVWLMHILVNFDTYLWAGLVVLLMVVFLIVIARRKRPAPAYSGYDPEDDWDDLSEEWDPDLYGNRPWRPRD